MEPEQVESGLPLDPNPYPAGSDVWRAYNQCLELERKQWTTSPEDLKAKPDPIMELGPRVVPRVLGRALCYAPCDQGRDALACEILDCKRDDELLTGLAHLYLYGLARVCAYSTRISPTVAASGSDSPLVCKPKSPTPSVSAGPSPGPSSSFGTAVEELEHLLRKSSIHVRELRKLVSKFPGFVLLLLTNVLGQLMHRDNNRCVFTGALDMNSVSEEMIDNASDPQLRIASLDVAHVISQSLSEGIDQPHSERAQIKVFNFSCCMLHMSINVIYFQFKWAKTVGAIIECFGGFSSHEILGAHVLNSPRNVFMTSSGTLHDMFDCFHIWLTPARVSSFMTIFTCFD
jgi:hypothetical protein